MGLTALDLGLRGAASGLFVMMVLVLLRLGPTNRNIVLGIAMSAGGAAFAIATAPFIPKSSFWWTLPLLSAQPVVFWLWARATFDDDFVLRLRHGVVWAAVVALGFACSLTWTSWPDFARAAGRGLSLIALGSAVLATVQTVRTWRDDLVARRRLWRVGVLVINLSFIAFVAGPSLLPLPALGASIPDTPSAVSSFITALMLFILSMLASWNLFGSNAIASVVPAMPAVAAGPAAEAPVPERDRASPMAADPLLLRRLNQLMTVERIYRQEGLSIGALAAKLDVPDYRLRRAINEGLGYRNFNAFLNHARIEDAKGGLADPAQQDVPILTIAIDAGFQSIGPFNRAFKAAMGVTPSEFRRQALSQASVQRETEGDFEIGKRGREIG